MDTGTADVIVPDYQLSLAIGKEGQNARLSARLTGWRIDIKSETQQAEEDAYESVDWAEGEWVVDPETGEQVWQPAEGGPALSAEEWEATSEGDLGEESADDGGEVIPQDDLGEESADDSDKLDDYTEENSDIAEDSPEEDGLEDTNG